MLLREESRFCGDRPAPKSRTQTTASSEDTRIVMTALVLRILVGQESYADCDLVLDADSEIPGIGDRVVRNSNWK